jgi:hypothetical protein
MSPGEPRRRVHKLHLNPAGPAILSRRSSGNLRLEHTGAQVFNHATVLLFHTIAQSLVIEFL